jgi:hypothetical protein
LRFQFEICKINEETALFIDDILERVFEQVNLESELDNLMKISSSKHRMEHYSFNLNDQIREEGEIKKIIKVYNPQLNRLVEIEHKSIQKMNETNEQTDIRLLFLEHAIELFKYSNLNNFKYKHFLNKIKNIQINPNYSTIVHNVASILQY